MCSGQSIKGSKKLLLDRIRRSSAPPPVIPEPKPEANPGPAPDVIVIEDVEEAKTARKGNKGKRPKRLVEAGAREDRGLLVGSRATLIVCPTSVLGNWVEQAAQHLAGVDLKVSVGTRRLMCGSVGVRVFGHCVVGQVSEEAVWVCVFRDGAVVWVPDDVGLCLCEFLASCCRSFCFLIFVFVLALALALVLNLVLVLALALSRALAPPFFFDATFSSLAQVLLYHGSNRRELHGDEDIVVTTYGTLTAEYDAHYGASAPKVGSDSRCGDV